MIILSKVFCYFTTTPIKIPTKSFTEIDKNNFQVYMETQNNQGSKKVLNNKITDGNTAEGNSQSRYITETQ